MSNKKIPANKYFDSPIHPGVTLRETIDTIGMSQVELALRMQRPEQTISDILNTKKSITPDTAIQLESVLGVPSSFWNNLQKNYDESIAHLEENQRLESEFESAKEYPYNEMVKLEWIEATTSLAEKTRNLLSFFGVNSLKTLPDLGYINYRKIKGKTISYEAIAAWLRQGEIKAQSIKTEDFDEILCKELIPYFRSLTTKDPRDFQEDFTMKLAKCGISFVVIPHLRNTNVCGAAKWLTPTKALIQLNLLGKWTDRFWFNFFHELGHILLHSKKDRYVDFKQSDDSDLEKEANAFASNTLIPKQEYLQFIKGGVFDHNSIVTFANKISIHPGIVLGRLQYEGILEYGDFRSLKTQYRFTNSS